MSKLDELLQELCPNGVQYQKLSDALSIERGKRVVREQLSNNGIYPVYQNSLTPLGFYSEFNFPAGMTFIIVAGAAGEIGYSSTPFWAADDCFVLNGNDKLFGRYLYHVLLKMKSQLASKVRKASIPRLSRIAIENLVIPVPPLEVQREIVRILDNFTRLTAELSAELSARQKQYEYYRDLLLSFKNIDNITDRQTDRQSIIKPLLYVNGFAWVTLDEISQNCDNLRKPITSGKRESGAYPYYGASGIVDYVKDFIFDGDYLLISEDGANLLTRNTPIAFSISGRNWVNNHAHVLKFDTYELRRYVEFYLNSIDLSSYISGGAQPKLNQKNLNRIPIPMPAPSECKRIVSILDRFDTLCNDLSAGLPAEIAARQQQYEYYRDKLLTFKELT